jgi:hypothetical protein
VAGLYPYFFARGWTAMLNSLGFAVEAEPVSAGTPFANVLLTAHAGGRPGPP